MEYGFYVCTISFNVMLVYMLIRNDWVSKKRKKLNRFENGVHIIKEYLSYKEMIMRFWSWDIEKLRKSK